MRGLRATAPCRTSKNDFHPYLLRAKIQDLLHALQLLAGTIIIPILQIETQTREDTNERGHKACSKAPNKKRSQEAHLDLKTKFTLLTLIYTAYPTTCIFFYF